MNEVAAPAGRLARLGWRLRPRRFGLRARILIVFTLGAFALAAFLAAGAIIQSRGNVKGLTTGANMWLAGALGVASGAGYYLLATAGAIFALIVLTLLGQLEAKLSRSRDEDAQEASDKGSSRRADKPRS